MKSPFRKIVVFDLETGGLKFEYNSITELAMVAIDLENLEIIDELQITLRPQLDLREVAEDSRREASILFGDLATKDQETNIKSLQYKGEQITFKELRTLTDDIENFHENYLNISDKIISYEEYLRLSTSEFSDIAKLYFDHCYNPQALEITHISIDMLLDEGVSQEQGVNYAIDFFQRHTEGNSKPILAGHNIRRFDNPFFYKFFETHGKDLDKYINNVRIIDTLEEARLKWFESSDFTLGTCANKVGITHKEAHRALPDTIVNAKVLIKFLQSLRGDGNETEEYVRRKFNFNF